MRKFTILITPVCVCGFFWTKQWFTSSSPSSWVLGYCVEKDDRRWAPMCSHSLNGPVDSGLMMGKEECTSPSGYYELLIPVNKKLDCSATKMKDTNCKDLDVSLRRLSCLWLMTYIFRDGEVLRVLINTNVAAFSQAVSFGFLLSWGCPADQTARRLCLRDWCGLGSNPTSTPRLPCFLAGILAVKLCDCSSCRRRMFSFVREVAQVVPAITSKIHRRHMRTRRYIYRRH